MKLIMQLTGEEIRARLTDGEALMQDRYDETDAGHGY